MTLLDVIFILEKSIKIELIRMISIHLFRNFAF